MKGNNTLTICMAELLVAIQEYLDKRMGEYAPKASYIRKGSDDSGFHIDLKEKEPSNDQNK